MGDDEKGICTSAIEERHKSTPKESLAHIVKKGPGKTSHTASLPCLARTTCRATRPAVKPCNGLYTSTAKLGRAKDKTPVIFRGAAKISNVVGALLEAENSDSLVTGSVSIAAGIITPDITATFDLNLR